MALRIVFMGTPDFAVPALDILVQHGFEVAAVVTATDKWGGRGKKTLIQAPVKQYALKHDIPVLQPANLKNPAFIESLASFKADVQIVVAFRMLPEIVWNMPPLGTWNLHGSLLPKYRGAAPINWAIINGDTYTGVTSFKLKHAIDTGDMLFQEKIAIGPEQTAGQLHDDMMQLGAEVVLKTAQSLEAGSVNLVPQPDEEATHAPKIFKETCQIDWSKNTQALHDFIRGLSPYPLAWTTFDGKEIKIVQSKKLTSDAKGAIGQWYIFEKNRVAIKTMDGWLEILSLKPAGSKVLTASDFVNGYRAKLNVL